MMLGKKNMRGPSPKIGGEKRKKKLFKNRTTGLVMDCPGFGEKSSEDPSCIKIN